MNHTNNKYDIKNESFNIKFNTIRGEIQNVKVEQELIRENLLKTQLENQQYIEELHKGLQAKINGRKFEFSHQINEAKILMEKAKEDANKKMLSSILNSLRENLK